jgi:hypothetical protein
MNITPPIVVDLETVREVDVDLLRSGTGALIDDVREVMRQVRTSAGPERAGRVFVPVVVVYSEPEQDEDEAVFEVWQEGVDRAED